MRILAVKLRAIGDSVIWTSALKRLAEAFPTAEVHVLSYESNAAVFENLRWVHAFHGLKSKSRWELIRALWGFRVEKFDWLQLSAADTISVSISPRMHQIISISTISARAKSMLAP